MFIFIISFLLLSTVLTVWKWNLNINGQQFHQYQQNEQPSLTSNQWTKKQKNSWHMASGLGQAQQCGGFKSDNPSPLFSTAIQI